jgi:hypothetical protein
MEALGRIDPFQLGTEDASDRLMFPVNGTSELVHLSGYSGIGKSSQDTIQHTRLLARLRQRKCGQWWLLLTILMRWIR